MDHSSTKRARAALAARLSARFGLDLDRLDGRRVRVALARAEGQTWDDPRNDALLRSLASGPRCSAGPVTVLPHLPVVVAQAARSAAGGRLRIWHVGAATGTGPQDLRALVGLVSRIEGGCTVLATDPDPVGLAALDLSAPPGVRVEARPLDPAGGDDPPGAFHLVLCRDLLRFLVPGAVAPATRQLARAVRPGGRLLVHGDDPPVRADGLKTRCCGPAPVLARPLPAAPGRGSALEDAWAHLEAGRLTRARQAANRLTETWSEDVEVRVFAARALQASGRPHSARRHAARALELDPGAVVPALLIAELDAELGRIDQAHEARRHAICLRSARLPEAALPYARGLPRLPLDRLAG